MTVAVNRNGIFYIRMQEFDQRVRLAIGRPQGKFVLVDKTADARLQLLHGRVVAAPMSVDAIGYLNDNKESPDRGKYQLIGMPMRWITQGSAFRRREQNCGSSSRRSWIP